jgi:hypothetical protein
MSALDTLIWKLTHEDHLAAVEKNRSRLEWAANITKETRAYFINSASE